MLRCNHTTTLWDFWPGLLTQTITTYSKWVCCLVWTGASWLLNKMLSVTLVGSIWSYYSSVPREREPKGSHSVGDVEYQQSYFALSTFVPMCLSLQQTLIWGQILLSCLCYHQFAPRGLSAFFRLKQQLKSNRQWYITWQNIFKVNKLIFFFKVFSMFLIIVVFTFLVLCFEALTNFPHLELL